MKKIFVIAVVVVMMAGLAYAKDFEVKKKAGQNDVTVTIDKNPPVVGENNVSVEVKDPSGKALTDAKVLINYSMAAMPGMPPMSYKAGATLSGGVYKAKMDLSMAGPWNIAVKITHSGKTSTVKFTVDAR